MAKPILIANWKNYPSSLDAATSLLAGLAKKRELYKKISTYVAPPLAYLESIVKKANFASLAVQDMPPVSKGTHTGLVGVDMLKSFGVRLAILGHSERRALGETDRQVAQKVLMALDSGFVPLVCVGEKARDEEGEHLEFLRQQIKNSLDGVRRKDAHKVMLAYEPVWAIGKRAKDALSAQDLAEMVIFIRKILTDMFGREEAEKMAVLYGGSVEPGNAESLYKDTGVRGFLVGHASLDASEFAKIAEALI